MLNFILTSIGLILMIMGSIVIFQLFNGGIIFNIIIGLPMFLSMLFFIYKDKKLLIKLKGDKN